MFDLIYLGWKRLISFFFHPFFSLKAFRLLWIFSLFPRNFVFASEMGVEKHANKTVYDGSESEEDFNRKCRKGKVGLCSGGRFLHFPRVPELFHSILLDNTVLLFIRLFLFLPSLIYFFFSYKGKAWGICPFPGKIKQNISR